MNDLKILTVSEDEGKSDCLSAIARFPTYGENSGRFYISIDTERKLTIMVRRGKFSRDDTIIVEKIDVDSFLEYLQDVKQFLSEYDVYDRIKGVR